VRFAVIGDSGTGERAQYAVATRLAEARSIFPYEFVLMLGDNLYGSERPQDFARKFEQPYAPLLAADVKFYASLGNHDDPNQRFFKPFNMNGERYYTFKQGPVRFFALDSNYMDRNQLEWLERELERSSDEWKIAFFHHPLYSTGARHGSEVDLRQQLEPLFVQHSMDVVFAGHEHFYERVKPQHGIHHFVSGAAAKLRRGNIRGGESSAAGFDTDYSFMLVEIADRTLYFQAISNAGTRVDDGALHPVPSRRTATTP
jgi:predicted phosphodiesterase